MHDDLIAQERPAEVAQDSQALGRVAVLLRAVEGEARLGLLGRVHGQISSAQQRVGVGPVNREASDPDAGVELQGQLVHLDRLPGGIE